MTPVPVVRVVGVSHYGLVLAAVLAEAGVAVHLTDLDRAAAARVAAGDVQLCEPGLPALVARLLRDGALSVEEELVPGRRPDVWWLARDSSAVLSAEDRAWLHDATRAVARVGGPATVALSMQVPVGTTRALERSVPGAGLSFAYVPENVRRGSALDDLRSAERTLVGTRRAAAARALANVLARLPGRVVTCSPETAELAKHAVSAFLALSVTFANELSRLAVATGADYDEVERALRADPRVGSDAYVTPGFPLGDGPLMREIRTLVAAAGEHDESCPLTAAVDRSNRLHRDWLVQAVHRALEGIERPRVAVWGLATKAGTNAFGDSAALAMVEALLAEGAVDVAVHEPAWDGVPRGIAERLECCTTPLEAGKGADLLVVGNRLPDYGACPMADVTGAMRRPLVFDPLRVLPRSGAHAMDSLLSSTVEE